ncbi:MAG: TIGR04255 family protein [Promethearchaeota archaeon]
MVDVEKYIEKSFINPYLNSVAFEIRFPASVRIIKDFSEFHDLINEDLPNFGEEFPFFDFAEKSKSPENLKKYVFSDDNEKNKVRLSINALTIVTKEYNQFDDFKEKINKIMTAFYNSFKVENCLRMGLRYINIYSLNNDLNESLEEIKELFNPFFSTELIPLNQVFSNNIEIRKNLPENNKITLRNKLQFNKAKHKFEHILDFDVYTHSKIPIQHYENFLLNLRIYEKTEFLRFVTEKFMEKMKFLD